MKNFIIFIFCFHFLLSCQDNKKEIQKTVSLPKIEVKEEIISPEYEIYNAIIEKLQEDKDTIFIFTYSSALFDKQGIALCKYCQKDTTKLFVKGVTLNKDTYLDFIRQAMKNQVFDSKFIKGENIIVNDSSQLNKLANDYNRYDKSFYRNIVINFSPIGLNQQKNQAFVIIDKRRGGNITEQCYLFEKMNKHWTIVSYKILRSGIICW